MILMTEMSDPRQTWFDLIAQRPGLQRRFEKHPLHLHFGTDHLSRPILLLRVKQKPEPIRLGDAVSVEIGERPGPHEWAMVLTLQDAELTRSFIDLCVDIATRSGAGTNEESALLLFRLALEEFQELLLARRGSEFSLEQLRGLIAELCFALDIVAPSHGAENALTAWVGPFGDPQDFRLPDGSLIEIKAIHTESRSIKISSPEQLDPSENSDLTLVTLGLEECASSNPNAVSAPGLIIRFQDALSHNSDLLDALDLRLKSLGISHNYRSFEDTFEITSRHHYQVEGAFPRIRRTDVTLGIDHLKYEIRLKALSDFEVHQAPSKAE